VPGAADTRFQVGRVGGLAPWNNPQMRWALDYAINRKCSPSAPNTSFQRRP